MAKQSAIDKVIDGLKAKRAVIDETIALLDASRTVKAPRVAPRAPRTTKRGAANAESLQ
jgi:hypothetical protein